MTLGQNNRSVARSAPWRMALQLLPHHGRSDIADPGRRVEAAIGGRDDASGIADRPRRPLDAVGNHLLVLDVVARRVDHADDERHVVGEGMALEARVLVGVTSVRHRQDECADVRLVEKREDLGERDVARVGSLVVAPAHMEAHGRPDRCPRARG